MPADIAPAGVDPSVDDDADAGATSTSLAREVRLFAFFATFLVPVVVSSVAVVFGGLLAAGEGWSFSDGFLYVMVDVLGMDVTLTDAAPTSDGGIVWDCFISFWSLGFAVVMFSFCFEMALCKRDLFRMLLEKFVRVDMVETYDENGRFIISRKRLLAETKVCLAFVLAFVPLLIGSLSVALGGLLAVVEGWSFKDGALFLIGNMCGIANPLTETKPENGFGKAAAVVIDCWALAVLGSFVGMFITSGVTRSWVEFERRCLEIGIVAAFRETMDASKAPRGSPSP